MVRLSRRNGIDGFERSLSQASRFVSVKVTLGGGLKVFVVEIVSRNCRRSSVKVNKDDRK